MLVWHLQLKMEKKPECSFLTCSLFVDYKKNNQKCTTSGYRRPSFSGVCTNIKNFLSSIYKFSTGYKLTNRCFWIRSSWTKLHMELTFQKQISIKDSKPGNFIKMIF